MNEKSLVEWNNELYTHLKSYHMRILINPQTSETIIVCPLEKAGNWTNLGKIISLPIERLKTWTLYRSEMAYNNAALGSQRVEEHIFYIDEPRIELLYKVEESEGNLLIDGVKLLPIKEEDFPIEYVGIISPKIKSPSEIIEEYKNYQNGANEEENASWDAYYAGR
ncbi:MAG: hypothetical protein HQL46_14805 [Gammaproteobacteria bacterium]|nr:hypothetical protein [Gammaproteobacteria bacterium]